MVIGVTDQSLSVAVDHPIERFQGDYESERRLVPSAQLPSYPQEQPAPVHPEENQPEDQEHSRSVEQGLVGIADDVERVLAEMGREAVRDETLPEPGHAVGGDRIHADHA